ncbi:hypothetical protein NBRC3257_2559 [Gluconobacter thailandicus NBRC 3257]|uniref:Uncharacterized protein n=1 Tax=Gluconobacter thailandicus NBRC 3257 TaxID=1381097 RepID=A0ABQ0IZD3_GLUTH|nr:hypothetical protein AD946_02675 [Gluconobacter thailandicus]GAC89145.1 hypothetical protein NBRC3255_2806 [Gluconobacter thailandicus NBRC 3255]GAD27560.1 hypothetical protein NBRC3257_2559 [Gluconobacter thailandicus NBRC 3257]
MMLQIHPQARTTPVVRAEIARSPEPAAVLARRYGIAMKRSANGADVERTPSRIAAAVRASWPGRRVRKNDPSSVSSGAQPGLAWTT